MLNEGDIDADWLISLERRQLLGVCRKWKAGVVDYEYRPISGEETALYVQDEQVFHEQRCKHMDMCVVIKYGSLRNSRVVA